MSQDAVVRKPQISFGTRSPLLAALSIIIGTLTPSLTETAIANGDTRTINLYYVHTQETISATYLVNGQYDRNVLQQLNWFLRDWRRDEPTNMDPRLFDVIWETYRSAGAGGEVIKVVSAYRSPETNSMLRARSRAVAKYSQHMLGKAMDTTMPGMPMSRIREIGMRMQRGGVGYYPTAGTPFVHLDVGNVRAWPRMTYDQLVQLFPDGKTVHIPSNGQPLARYEEAKAEIEARNNGAIVMEPRKSPFGFLAFLFGGGEDEAEDAAMPAPTARKQWAVASRDGRNSRVAATESDEEGGGEAPPETGRRKRSEALAKAEANLPRGETVMTAAPAPDEGAANAKAEAVARAEAEKAEKAEAAAAKAAAKAEAAEGAQPEEKREERGDAPAAKAAAKAEAAEREKLARAPLPPERPASLEKPRPQEALPADRRIAGLEPQEAPFNPPSAPAEEPIGADSGKDGDVVVPLPPRRPNNLAVASAAPLPPARPVEFAAAGKANAAAAQEAPSETVASTSAPVPQPRPKNLGAKGEKGEGALSNLMGAADSAGHGAKPRSSGEDEPLAFAPPASAKTNSPSPKPTSGKTTIGKTTPGPGAELVPARLDRSNFQAMTATSENHPSAAVVRSAPSDSESSGLRDIEPSARGGILEDVTPAPVPGKFDELSK